MAYADELAKLTRTKITLVEVDLDKCKLTWGVSPCTPIAGGSECYNTYRTCNDYDVINEIYKTNYDKGTVTLRFTSAELPAPGNGYRPYLKSYNALAQEIKDNITVKNRITVELIDDNGDSDIDTDPYWSTRGHSSIIVNGSYFKRLFARNPNFKYKSVRIYEGFTLYGVLTGSWQLRFSGKIENIIFERGIVKLECIDDLKFLDASNLSTTCSGTLAVNISHTQTTGISVTSTTGMAASGGYILVENEIIFYSSLSGTTLVTVTRGVFGTIKSSHAQGTKISRVYLYYGNPFDIMEDILTDAGVGYDITSFAELSGNVAYTLEPNVAALIIKDTKRSDLFWELVEQFACKVWLDENGYVKIRRNIYYAELPSLPSYLSAQSTLTDDQHIIDNSCAIDWNEKNRFTGINYYYDLKVYNAKRSLSAAINSTATTVPVTSIDDLPDKGEVIIGSEFIEYVGLNYTSIALTGCTRGARSTTAAAHSIGDAVYQGDVSALGEPKEPGSFKSVTITTDADAETEYGSATAKTYYSRWFNTFAKYAPLSFTITGYGTYITAMSVKMLASIRDARQRFTFETEIKDEGIQLGDFHLVTTDEFNEPDTTDFTDKQFQVVKKEPSEGGKIKFTSERIISYD